MANTLIIDRLKDSRYRSERNRVRIIRSGLVHGIDTSVPSLVMTNAILATPGCPQYGEPHPAIRACTCIGHEVALESSGIAMLNVIYETPIGNSTGADPDSFQIELSSTLIGIRANKSPINGQVIEVQYTPKGGSTNYQYPYVQYQRPMQVLSAKGVFTKALGNAFIQQVLGHVNKTPWNGYGVGFWLCHDIRESTADGGKTWNESISFMSNMVEDWSSWAIYELPATGAYGKTLVKIDLSTAASAYNNTQSQGNGFSQIGLYPMADFAAAFPGITSK